MLKLKIKDYNQQLCIVNLLNRDDFDVIIVYFSHLMMAQEGRNM
jgi:hypothetical protein